MQKHVNINIRISLNSFNRYKLKIVFLLEIYLKAILDLECYKQTIIIVQISNKIFIAKSLQQILKLVCFAIM